MRLTASSYARVKRPAFAAVTPSAFVIGVDGIVSVSSFAVRLLAHIAAAFTTANVLGMGHLFKVIRSDTGPIPAYVIPFEIRRWFAGEEVVGEELATGVVELAVAVGIEPSEPDVTTVCAARIDTTPEAGCGRWSQLRPQRVAGQFPAQVVLVAKALSQIWTVTFGDGTGRANTASWHQSILSGALQRSRSILGQLSTGGKRNG